MRFWIVLLLLVPVIGFADDSEQVVWEDKFDPNNPPKPRVVDCIDASDCKLIIDCEEVIAIPTKFEGLSGKNAFAGQPKCEKKLSAEKLKDYQTICYQNKCDKEDAPIDHHACTRDRDCALYVGLCKTIQAVNSKYLKEYKNPKALINCIPGDVTTTDNHRAKCIQTQCTAEPK
ncbi:hypothetical protein ACLVWU_08710 [Bdellovibrio sp. HCB290]|uniref:hypothetical protein n=1 Tax=Bdellovibrio sp. HCB290 TaxID=3394356 RepID=UPI0039B4D542